MAPTPPPELFEGEVELEVELGLPEDVGMVKGPLVVFGVGITMAPLAESRKIGGFSPVTKPETVFADSVGPESPKVPSKD